MYAQCDVNGVQQLLMKAIVGHKRDKTAVDHADRFVTVNGRQHHSKTTRGWKMCVEWKDGSTSWERLSDSKESYPIKVAEYALAQGIEHKPAFAWWMPHVLRRRECIL